MVRSTAAVRLLAGDKEPVRLASTANLALAGLLTVDGVVTVAGDRVLVKDQTNATENGIYTASEGGWQRAPDAASNRTLVAGMKVAVQQGTAHAGDIWVLNTDRPDIGNDDIIWVFYLGTDTVAAINQAALDFAAIADDILATAWAATTAADYASKAAAILTVKPVGMTYLRTAGLDAAGDGGGHIYKKGVSLTPGGFQDAGGVYWDLAVDGGAAVVDTRSAAALLKFHNTTNFVLTGGLTAVGDGGGTTYKRGSGSGSFTDAAGTSWVPFAGTSASTAPEGRLTLASGQPVMAASVTAATTLYYAPFTGTNIPINTGGVVRLYRFTASPTDAVGLSIVLGANWAANSNYDVYAALNGGVVTLATGPDWSAGAVAGSNAVGSSTRGTGAGSTELQLYLGYLTNKNTITLRYANTSTFSAAANEALYLGTFRTGAAGQISFTYGANGTAGTFNLWNCYNQVEVGSTSSDSTSSWTYSSATIRQANASATNQFNFIVGLSSNAIAASGVQNVRPASSAAAFGRIGIALNSTTVFDKTAQATNNAAAAMDSSCVVNINYKPQLGANFISQNEAGDGSTSTTFIAASFQQLSVRLMM